MVLPRGVTVDADCYREGMKLHISAFTPERQWRAASGADQARVEKLLVLFTASYGDLFGHSVAHRQAELAVTPS